MDRVILEEDPDKKIPNAVLIINEIQMSDRGIYKCVAFSNITKSEESVEVMVRIKGKIKLKNYSKCTYYCNYF